MKALSHTTRRAALAALFSLVAGLSACGGASGSAAPAPPPAPPPPPPESWVLDWSDEFDGSTLDAANWGHDTGAGGWGNNELEFYQPANATVQGGMLTITAKQESVGGAPYTSSRILTAGKKRFTYGRFEIRAKLPEGQGLWPAFWLLGDNFASMGWPGCGEIDALEMIGGLADDSGDFTAHGTLHYLNASGVNPAPSFAFRNATRLGADFHTYTIDWTPTSITWKLDGVAYGTRALTADMEEFQKPFFIILNLAVGGNWGGYPDGSATFPQTFVIDYVRHYAYPG